MHVCCALILTLLTFQKNGTTRPQRLTSRTACTTGELFAIVCPSIQFPQHRNPPATRQQRQQERLLGTKFNPPWKFNRYEETNTVRRVRGGRRRRSRSSS
ncbi:hypothetical protein C8J57DRAFT_1401929 [Mycena rebaudengoi]|nr:hypothetical protein C8J57DRAFT_1401929 [Mycena rebaudengoi]